MENYPGFADVIQGPWLMEQMQAQAAHVGTELITDMMGLHRGSLMLLGPTLDPKTAFTLSMRLPHLPLRIVEHSRRARLFAERMQAMGLRVHYPGLASHPDHAILERIANPRFGAGGIVALDTGDQETAHRLMDTLQHDEEFGFIAVSLGYHHTLMSASATSTSSELDDDELARAKAKLLGERA